MSLRHLRPQVPELALGRRSAKHAAGTGFGTALSSLACSTNAGSIGATKD